MSEKSAEDLALDAQGAVFLAALDARRAGDIDTAEEKLRDIIKVEPRLAEPHMELGRILLDTDRLEAAEGEAREALDQLAATGTWTDEIPENIVHALAHALLAEVLRRRADEDDVIFGDPETFHALLAEAKEHFALAAKLDPSDEYSSFHVFFMGVGQTETDSASSS